MGKIRDSELPLPHRSIAAMNSANLIFDDQEALKAHVVTGDVITTVLKALNCVLDGKVYLLFPFFFS